MEAIHITMNTSSSSEVKNRAGDVDGNGANATDKKIHTDTSETADREDSEYNQTKEGQFAFEALNDATLNDEDERLPEAIDKAQRSHFTICGRKLFENEKKSGLIAKRRAQATIHTVFTDLRIQDLEKQLRQVRIDLYKLPKDFEATPKEKDKHPIFVHVLQHSTPDKFEMKREMLKIPLTDRPALEVLVVEHFVDSVTHSESTSLHTRVVGSSNTQLATKSLRIRPRPLIAHLQQITRTHISDDVSPPPVSWTVEERLMLDSIVFLQPFKLFVMHEEEIRRSLQDLEEKVHGPSSQKEAVHQSKRIHDAYNDEDLVLDLRLLVKFIDEDMAPIFDLRRRIREGTAIDIEYQDLWHLFSYGDIVVVQSDKSHAYRVLSFTGGREIQTDRLDEKEEKRPILPGFMVDCLSIKSDGLNYIPQLYTFNIRPFLGRQPITSLPVYPLKFDENRESLRRDLTAQGQRYLDLTIPPQLHRHLLGRTLDEPSHDIDAQVIIDMSMALNSVPEWRPRERSINRDQLTKADHRETFIRPTCGHMKYVQGHCGGDIAFPDLNMDEQNANEFF